MELEAPREAPPNRAIRCMGVIQFVLYTSNFHHSYVHIRSCFVSTNVCQSTDKNWVGSWTSLDVVMIIRSVCLLILWLDT